MTFDNNDILLQLQVQELKCEIHQLLTSYEVSHEEFYILVLKSQTKLDLKIAQKCIINELLPIYQNFSQFRTLHFGPSHIPLLLYTSYFQSPSFVMTLLLCSQLKLHLSYVYSSFANTDITCHKETWVYYEIYELFAWTFFCERTQS